MAEHAKDDEEVVVAVVVEENAKHQEAEKNNVEEEADEHQVKHHTEEEHAGCLEKHESQGGEDNEYKAEESVQQQYAEEAGNIDGNHIEPSPPYDKSKTPTEDEGNKVSSELRERSREIESEGRQEVPAGLVYIDYSQFDEDEEVGSTYGLGGSTYGLGGGGSDDSYNLSQAGVTEDSSPIGMTDEKVYKGNLKKMVQFNFLLCSTKML